MLVLTEQLKAKLITRLKAQTIYRDDCWIFTGARYGRDYRKMNIKCKRYLTHRLSADIFLGLDINNDSINANHKSICKSKSCWNPDHLYVGTQADNMKDVHNEFIASNPKCPTCGSTRVRRRKRLVCHNCRNRRYRTTYSPKALKNV